MIRPGEVRGVRQLARGVQAQVCLGADTLKGSAVITVETNSEEVMAALAALHEAIRKDARQFVGDVLEGQRQWDEESGYGYADVRR